MNALSIANARQQAPLLAVGQNAVLAMTSANKLITVEGTGGRHLALSTADASPNDNVFAELQLHFEEKIRKAHERLAALGDLFVEDEEKSKQRDDELGALRQELLTSRAAAERARREQNANEKTIIELQDEVEALSAQLDGAKGEVAALQTERKNALQEYAKLRAQLSGAKGEIATLQREYKNALQELYAKIAHAAAREIGRAVAVFAVGDKPSRLWSRVLLRQKVEKLKGAEIVDGEWYLRRYPDVADAGVDPFVHYLVHGAREGREPKPLVASEAGQAGANSK